MNNILNIKWQRLVFKGETCTRCGSTEKELEKAVYVLRQMGIKVKLDKEEISISKFKEDTLQSNKIWINNRLLESYINGKVNQSSCCDVCGSSECRTVEIKGKEYETIPAILIVKAGFIAFTLKK